MKSSKFIFAIILSAFLSVLSLAPCSAITLEQAIELELQPLTKFKCNYGIKVVECETGRTLYQAGAETPLMPASNQKLLSTITALAVLGPDFEFTTTLARRGEDYIVIGDGDPGIGDFQLMTPTTKLFDDWAIKLRESGVTEITGKLIFDGSVFESQFCHPNWSAHYLDQWYAAPVGGLNLNDNCIELSVNFDEARKAQLVIAPAMKDLTVEPNWIQAKSAKTIINPAWESREDLKINVTLGTQAAGPVCFTVKNPLHFFASVLQDRFQAYGIAIKGPVEFQKIRNDDGSLPKDLTIVAQHKTPIFDTVTRANKNSQNLFAECLFKRAGYQAALNSKQTLPGSWTTGELAAKAFLLQIVKTPVADLVFDDGSGLSRHNRQTAQTFADLLTYAKNQPWAARFIQTLAIAGTEGTLWKRMRNTPAEGKIFAKTGYISKVSALSGYVVDGQNQPRIVFSMLFNFSPSGKLWQVKTIEDKICIALAQSVEGRPTTTSTTKPVADNQTEENAEDDEENDD
jgi:D-alanyl-D-alanine carboxypeptidase/D-alanyl-D-alanine-endopeptidase (penicillin-binding protein 4)